MIQFYEQAECTKLELIKLQALAEANELWPVADLCETLTERLARMLRQAPKPNPPT